MTDELFSATEALGKATDATNELYPPAGQVIDAPKPDELDLLVEGAKSALAHGRRPTMRHDPVTEGLDQK